MKKLVLVLFVAFISGSALMAQVNQNFTLDNQTGLAIDQLYISPSDVQDWEEDVLGVDILQNGQQAEIHFSPQEERCDWDIKIVDADGDAVIWTDIDLCKAATVTLHYDNGTPTASIENTDADDNAGNPDGEEQAEDASDEDAE